MVRKLSHQGNYKKQNFHKASVLFLFHLNQKLLKYIKSTPKTVEQGDMPARS